MKSITTSSGGNISTGNIERDYIGKPGKVISPKKMKDNTLVKRAGFLLYDVLGEAEEHLSEKTIEEANDLLAEINNL